ncbi:MAG TPA: AraC family transcriptional regulator [Opitutaceae bacterium]|nr:AraC family transcriptional regulator [Opitutaceae bacterium]HND60679.1 AraC family transcriptional regulator [Opitutaceae bacterium]
MKATPAVGPSPIESIRLVERFERREPRYAFTATSLPGHLIHLVVAGEVEQVSGGRRQLLRPGSVVWYHEDEWVEGRVRRAPWIYYSVNFAAPTLAPPDFDRRLVPATPGLEATFAALLEAWRSTPSGERDWRCQSHLLALLAAVAPSPTERRDGGPGGKLWWDIEAWARQRIDRAHSLGELCTVFGRSPNTVARACRDAVGMAPMKRLKQIRLSLARGLVRHSELNMTEIARRVGYARVHEFSRDFRRAHGLPPTADRSGTPPPR